MKEGNVYWPILVGRAAYFGAVQVFFMSVSIYFGDASGVKIHQPGAFAHDVGWNDLEAWSGESKNRTRRPLLWGRRISMLALDFILSVAPIPVDLHGVPVVVAKPSPKPWLSVALVQYPKDSQSRRSRTAVAGMRRVNYYLKHLLVDAWLLTGFNWDHAEKSFLALFGHVRTEQNSSLAKHEG